MSSSRQKADGGAQSIVGGQVTVADAAALMALLLVNQHQAPLTCGSWRAGNFQGTSPLPALPLPHGQVQVLSRKSGLPREWHSGQAASQMIPPTSLIKVSAGWPTEAKTRTQHTFPETHTPGWVFTASQSEPQWLGKVNGSAVNSSLHVHTSQGKVPPLRSFKKTRTGEPWLGGRASHQVCAEHLCSWPNSCISLLPVTGSFSLPGPLGLHWSQVTGSGQCAANGSPCIFSWPLYLTANVRKFKKSIALCHWKLPMLEMVVTPSARFWVIPVNRTPPEIYERQLVYHIRLLS